MSPCILSVVIPNFNGAAYLSQLLGQLQSISMRERLELIIMDGGSSDNSASIAHDLTHPHDIVVSMTDEGQADAIARGLAMANGSWFMFQNSDDLFHIPALEEFLKNAARFDDFDVVAFDQAVRERRNDEWRTYRAFAHSRPVTFQQLSRNIYYTNQSTIYRTEKAKVINFDKTKQFAMDYDFVVRFFREFRPSVSVVEDVLGIQSMHPGTKTSNMSDVCDIETREIRGIHFSSVDIFWGTFQSMPYHFGKRLRSMFDPRFRKSDLFI